MRVGVILFTLFFLSFLPWAVGMWPGAFTTDSLNTLTQLKTGEWNNWHSYIFTAYIALLRELPLGLGSIIIVQI